MTQAVAEVDPMREVAPDAPKPKRPRPPCCKNEDCRHPASFHPRGGECQATGCSCSELAKDPEGDSPAES